MMEIFLNCSETEKTDYSANTFGMHIAPIENGDPNYIIEVVCKYHKVTPSQVFNQSRKREVVTIRNQIRYLMRKYTRLSFNSIAAYGYEKGFAQDHATAINSCNSISDLIDTDPKIKKEIEYFSSLIR